LIELESSGEEAKKLNKRVLILPAVLLAVLLLATILNGTTQAISDAYQSASESHDGMAVIANITLGQSISCMAVNDETNRVYIGVYSDVNYELIVIDGGTD
jgi:hypothetical protein